MFFKLVFTLLLHYMNPKSTIPPNIPTFHTKWPPTTKVLFEYSTLPAPCIQMLNTETIFKYSTQKPSSSNTQHRNHLQILNTETTLLPGWPKPILLLPFPLMQTHFAKNSHQCVCVSKEIRPAQPSSLHQHKNNSETAPMHRYPFSSSWAPGCQGRLAQGTHPFAQIPLLTLPPRFLWSHQVSWLHG